MRTRISLTFSFLTASLTAPLAQAEDLAFHNILTVSRSIISPSQYYQMKEGILIEAAAATVDGSLDVRSNTFAAERDIKGSELNGGAFLAINPSLVFGVTSSQTNLHVKATGKVEERSVNPSVAYSPIAALTLGAQINLLRGENKPQTTPTIHRKTNNFAFGMTAHEETWEATAVLSTAKKDEDNAFNSLPQTIGLHGRYRVFEPVTLGLTYEQSDYTAVTPDSVDSKDQSHVGVHVEAAMSENFSLELDYTATHNESGVNKRTENETVILWQFLINPTLEGGAKLTYNTLSAPNTEVKRVSPGLFVAARF